MRRNRVVIYPKDIQLITGRGERYAERILMTIKRSLGKEKHQFVTYQEFCEFCGLSIQDIEDHLR